jgi:hypothetical protein
VALLAAQAGKVEGIQDVLAAEFYALEHAVDVALDIGAIVLFLKLILNFWP